MFIYQTLTLTAEGYGGTVADTYRWYVDNKYIANAINKTFTFNSTHVTTYAGNHEIFCFVSNALGAPVKSNVITAIVQTAVHGELTGIKFKDKDNVEHTVGKQLLGQEKTTEGGYPGDMYQYGRAADGHEKFNSPVVAKPAASITPPYQSVDGESLTGKFITVNPWSTDVLLNTLWTSSNNYPNPCPSGWHLPTVEEMRALMPASVVNGAGGKSTLAFDAGLYVYKWCNDLNECVHFPLSTARAEDGSCGIQNFGGNAGEYHSRFWGAGAEVTRLQFEMWPGGAIQCNSNIVNGQTSRGLPIICFKN
jgi:hypothetical protein